MRRFRALTVLATAGAAVLFISCSKKSAGPTAPTNPACAISPTSLDFGVVQAGGAADRLFTIRNTGGGQLSGTISVPPGPFDLVGSPPTYDLSAGQSITYGIHFHWVAEGPATCVVATGTSGCGAIQCTAQGAPSPCGVVPSALSFGHVLLGGTKDLQFSVSNTGSTQFIATAQETCADFSMVEPAAFFIDPGQSATYTVRFTPTRAGSQTCTVSLSNICSPVVCTAIGDPTSCYVSPLELDFGTVKFDDLPFRTFVVRNDGGGQLTGQVQIPAANAQEASFVLVDADPSYDLAPGTSKTFTVQCLPRVIAPDISCDITTGTAPCSQVHCRATIQAAESGSCSGAFIDPATLDFGSVAIGQTATRTIHVSAPADCVYPEARLQLHVYGPDFAFDDGEIIKTSSLDGGPVNWTLNLKFTPTVEGEEAIAMMSFRFCGPPGTSGFPCQTLMGSGIGVRTGAKSGWKPAQPWRPRKWGR